MEQPLLRENVTAPDNSQHLTAKGDYRLLRIPLMVEDIEVHALLDTGSPVSLMSQTFFKRLPSYANDESSEWDEERRTFQSAAGNEMRSLGKYELRIYLNKRHRVKHAFHIIPDLVEPVILGLDLIIREGLTIDGPERRIKYPRGEKEFEIIANVFARDNGINNVDLGLPYKINSGKDATPDQKEQIRELMYRYKEIFGTSIREVGKLKNVQVRVKLTNRAQISLAGNP